jgi:hypothetical protein
LSERAETSRQLMQDKPAEHRQYSVRCGEDMPEVCDWVGQGFIAN